MTFRQFIPDLPMQTTIFQENPSKMQSQQHQWASSHFFCPESTFSRNIQHNNLIHAPKKRRNIRLNLKSEPSQEKIKKINERRGKYKRSTNNSHKKFICVARRLLMRLLNEDQREHFDNDFQAYKNSRTYYFIILAHAKLLLSPENIRDFSNHFLLLMNNKIDFYKMQVMKTDNRNFINFRCDEIADIQYALQAFDLYFNDKVEEAIETIYKKEKISVLKKNQCEQAIEVVKYLEQRLKNRQVGQNQMHNVIILQQNKQLTSYLPEESQTQKQDHEVEDHANSDPISEQKSSKIPQASIQKQIKVGKNAVSLLQLQNSYPIYDYFYDVMFPHRLDKNFFPPNSMNFLFNYMQLNQLDPTIFNAPIQNIQVAQGGTKMLDSKQFYLKKTATDEQMSTKLMPSQI